MVALVVAAFAIERHWNRQRDAKHADDAWPKVGQWHEVAAPTVSDEEHLLALGYLEGVKPAPAMSGVTVNAQGAGKGVNLYVSGHAAEAYLIAMDGSPLHTWSYPREKAFPTLAGFAAKADEDRLYWRYAKPRDDGSIIAVYEGAGLVALDWYSKPLWTHQGYNHHDVDIAADGSVWALGRKRHVVSWLRDDPVIDDTLQILSADGRLQKEISVLEALHGSSEEELLRTIPPGEDVLHTNAVRVLDGRFARDWPALTDGRVLLSIREIDALVVIDVASAKAVWSFTGTFRRQHAPELLANGRMLLFDNRGVEGRSRVMELTPNGRATWLFDGKGAPFYSETCGGEQRLANGNTLIAETEPGRALEVTPAGDIVWEFWNPHRTGKNDRLIAALFQMTRLPASFGVPPAVH